MKYLYLSILVLCASNAIAQNYFTTNGFEGSLQASAFESKITYRLGYMNKKGWGLGINRGTANRLIALESRPYSNEPSSGYAAMTGWGGDVNYTPKINSKRFNLNFMGGINSLSYDGIVSGGGFSWAVGGNIYYNVLKINESTTSSTRTIFGPLLGFTYVNENGSVRTYSSSAYNPYISYSKMVDETKVGLLLGVKTEQVCVGLSANLILFNRNAYPHASLMVGMNL
jgi:hypothetical protein